MKTNSTLFLKIVVASLGLGVLLFDIAAFIASFSSDDISEFRIVLFALILSSLPFFFGLFQIMKLLKYIDIDKGFSELSVRALRQMKICALLASVVYLVLMPIVYLVGQYEDAPGLIAIGLVLVFIAVVVATFTAVLEKLVQNGFEIKSENDLTV